MSSKEPSSTDKAKEKAREKAKDKSKVHKLSLKGSSKLVAEFFQYSIHTILYATPTIAATRSRAEQLTRSPQVPTRRLPSRRLYGVCAPRTSPYIHLLTLVVLYSVKKYGLNMLVSADDQVKAYIKKIMSQLDKWMVGGKISKLVIVITDKDTGEHVERWQFDVQISQPPPKAKSKTPSSSTPKPTDQENTTPGAASAPAADKTEAEIQAEIAAIFRQITASVTFLPQLSGDCTFNVLVYADADSDVPVEWGDSDAKEIAGGEHVQLRGFSTASHRVDTLVSYRLGE
ncbi:Mitotic spindle checkpoint component mad2 [Tolypocladium ophioglossoides CBS 100239]|uniref:Mitotic spindle checkpoint component mad2 n=1 Tax=Tolypocladium ophioglossoides (strain CBS 100239) TaxID=1163406 RepID=A0A0L0NME0_TOLOC|nr:Mitotic spindle checkpoint component mad2 [Tolypocladium ophioglossoides CBS 100239]